MLSNSPIAAESMPSLQIRMRWRVNPDTSFWTNSPFTAINDLLQEGLCVDQVLLAQALKDNVIESLLHILVYTGLNDCRTLLGPAY